MNNQEAIDLLDNLIGVISDNQDSDYDGALKLGIKALSAKEDLGKHLSEIYAEIAQNNTDYSCGFRYGYKSAIDDVARYERW